MRLGFLTKKSGKTLPVNCTRTLKSEHGVVLATFDCLNCGAEGDLRSPTCYRNVLQAFVKDLQIDSLVLADLNHRQYAGGLIDVLRGQAELIRSYERAGARPGAAEEEPKSKCRECALRPSAVFMQHAEALGQRPVAGVEDAIEGAQELATTQAPEHHAQCVGCLGQTVETANHLASRAVEVRALLGGLAYNVSEARE